MLSREPVEGDLRAVERRLLALWEAIRRATATGDWRPRPGGLCDWCSHRALCAAWGGRPAAPPPCSLVTATDPAAERGERPAVGAR